MTKLKKPPKRPVSARKAKTGKSPLPAQPPHVRNPVAVDLAGNRIYGTGIPHRQLNLLDKADFVRTIRGVPAVVCRENGERASGDVSADAMKGLYEFTERETGKMYSIPARCCAVEWAGDIAVISIPEAELSRRVSLYGMFPTCHLF